MKTFTCYSCTIRRKHPQAGGMDRYDEMSVTHVTAPHFQVLARLHGMRNISNVQPNGQFEVMTDETLAKILSQHFTRTDKAAEGVSPREALQEMVLSPIARQESLPTELPISAEPEEGAAPRRGRKAAAAASETGTQE